MKKFFCIIFALLLILSLSGCGNDAAYTAKAFDSTVKTGLYSQDVVAENNSLRLLWDKTKKSLILYDIASDKTWGISPQDEESTAVDELGMPLKRHPQLESSLLVYYIDVNTNVENLAVSYTDSVNNGKVKCTKIENGILIEYYFSKLEIMIPIKYVLREDSLLVSLDAKEIAEGDKYKVTKVSVAPFMSSVKNTESKDYLFYPSGSGAITYAKERNNQGETSSNEVYGTDLSKEIQDKITNEKSVRMPVYGAKVGENAICAIIEDGADSAIAEMKVGAKALGYSSCYATFQIRGTTSNIAEMFTGWPVKNDSYGKRMADGEYSVGFYPLTGENADYSGMAKCYKSYISKKYSANSKKRADNSGINLIIIGGTLTEKSFLGIPYDSLYAATSIKEAKEIVSELSKDINISNVQLYGFGGYGVDLGKVAGNFAVGNKFGTINDLKDFNEFCKDKDINAYFDFDIVKFKNSGKGLNSFFDAAVSASGKMAYQYDFDVATRSKMDTTRYQLTSRSKLKKTADKLLNSIKKWKLDGISLSTLSNRSYSDYRDKTNSKYYVKSGMSADAVEIYKSINCKVMSDDANDYAAVMSDVVINTPTYSSKERVFDYDIPFYQMVFGSFTSLSGECVNTSENSRRQILKCVESGIGLTYSVYKNYDNCLIESNTNNFWGSNFNDVKPKMKEEYKKLSDYYKTVSDFEIKHNGILENGLRETVFADGTVVYVNYSAKSLESPIGIVKAMDYVYKEGKN